MTPYLVVGLVAAVVTAITSAIVLRVSRKFRLAPAVRERDMHTDPTPRLGGVAMYMGILVGFLTVMFFPRDIFASTFHNSVQMWTLLGSVTIIVIVGVLDDLFDLDWMLKLGAQIVAAGLLAWQGVQILSLPLGNTLIIASPYINLVLTVLLMVTVMNAVNFIDGLDGLVAGFAIIANLAFFVYTRLLSRDLGGTESVAFSSLIAVLLIGVCVGFLPFNWHRAKMFMGDSGALLIGLLMATSTIAVTGQLNPAALSTDVVIASWIPILLPMAVLAMPLTDLLLAVVRRVRAGKSPFAADRLHLHHKLINRGHSHTQAAMIFHLWTFVIALACLLTFTMESYVAPILTVILGSIVCVVVTLVPASRAKEWLRLNRSK